MIRDSAGALYGTTFGATDEDPSGNLGTVFKLTPDGSGGYNESVLKIFNGSDGANPYAGVIRDSAGALYGTTHNGGSGNLGTVFKLTPNGSGGYTHSMLKSFNGVDGAHPFAEVIQDGAGALYGTTIHGSSGDYGTVFKLTPNGSGGYTHSVLKSFDLLSDGAEPHGRLIQDSAGTLYGTTQFGTSGRAGTVFKLTPNDSGTYTHTILKSFQSWEGWYPIAGVIRDSAGALYGTTYQGDRSGGKVFKLTPDGSGAYTHSVIKSFDGSPGGVMTAGVIQDNAGALYGTTYYGTGAETVFKLTPDGSGGYTHTVLKSFVESRPFAGVIRDSTGALYGTTVYGGEFNGGTVFRISFGASPPGDTTPPTAIAGLDQNIRAGDTVLLNGSASFDDNTASPSLLYSWSFSSRPAGSTATLTGAATATPSFVADVTGTYDVQLVVTDAAGLTSPPDHVKCSSANLAPTAHATVDYNLVFLGETAHLNGSTSTDPELDPLSYSWTITAKPLGSTASLVNADTATPTLTADLDGVYEVALVVSDFIGPSTPTTIQITATTAPEFAEVQIVNASGIISGLTAGQVTTQGNQTAMLNFFSQAMVALQQGNLATAIDKLQKSLERTDGCVLRGSPDGNGVGRDWITDCAAQTQTYTLLNAALNALTP